VKTTKTLRFHIEETVVTVQRRTHKKLYYITAKFQGRNYKQQEYLLSMSTAVIFYNEQAIILLYCTGGSRQ